MLDNARKILHLRMTNSENKPTVTQILTFLISWVLIMSTFIGLMYYLISCDQANKKEDYGRISYPQKIDKSVK